METIDLTKLPVTDRLKLMEELWNSLDKTDPLPTPAWHDALIQDRLHRLDKGQDTVSSWEAAKQRIRAHVTSE